MRSMINQHFAATVVLASALCCQQYTLIQGAVVAQQEIEIKVEQTSVIVPTYVTADGDGIKIEGMIVVPPPAVVSSEESDLVTDLITVTPPPLETLFSPGAESEGSDTSTIPVASSNDEDASTAFANLPEASLFENDKDEMDGEHSNNGNRDQQLDQALSAESDAARWMIRGQMAAGFLTVISMIML
jgi:hypothetical protein